jgi:hypothetical protein
MKQRVAFAILLTVFGLRLWAEDAKTNSPAVTPVKVPAKEAKSHIGAEAIVTGQVAEVNQTERLIRLNLEKPYPNQAFTAVIFSPNTNLFKNLDLPSFKDKTVQVSGTIADYHGHPEIILTGTNQLRLVQAPTDAGK